MAAVIDFAGTTVVIKNGQASSDDETVTAFVQSHIDAYLDYAPEPDVAKARDFVAHCGGTVLSVDLPEYTAEDAGRVY